jgi:adenosylhomocysteinase
VTAPQPASRPTATGSRIDWVLRSCRLLAATREEFERTQPFAGLRVGTGIHLEPKTVALLLTLLSGGAELVSTGNLNSTQEDACDRLRAAGATVIGGWTDDEAVHDGHLRELLAHEPHLLLDNGGDLFTRWLDHPYDGLLGGTEETTSGRNRLLPLRSRLGVPILVINDSPIKQFGENLHAVGQSVLESFMRITNRMTNGRHVVVFGYGPCGQGVAVNFKGAHARVSVVETDPVLRLRALLDGYAVPDKAEALAAADVVVTVTGAPSVLDAGDLTALKDGAVVANGGHLPWEIDLAGWAAAADHVEIAGDGIESYVRADGTPVYVLAGGHMVNLAGPRPLGNSVESMDLGFTLQARCLEAVARGIVDASACLVPVPASIDAQVASAYVALARS